jgi:hypothetical protein
MNERTLRRRCRRELRDLDIQSPLDVHMLCRRLGQRRGRPIRLTAYPLPLPGPLGVWVATAMSDHIVFQRETSKIHQDHIILHEVGHILAGHGGEQEEGEAWERLFPDISADHVRAVLGRTTYDHAHEREAELVATIILEWASVLDRVAPSPPTDPAMRRVASALNDRRGWL